MKTLFTGLLTERCESVVGAGILLLSCTVCGFRIWIWTQIGSEGLSQNMQGWHEYVQSGLGSQRAQLSPITCWTSSLTKKHALVLSQTSGLATYQVQFWRGCWVAVNQRNSLRTWLPYVLENRRLSRFSGIVNYGKPIHEQGAEPTTMSHWQ